MPVRVLSGASLKPEYLDKHAIGHPAADIVSWIQSICQGLFRYSFVIALIQVVTSTASYLPPGKVWPTRLDLAAKSRDSSDDQSDYEGSQNLECERH